VGCGIFDYEDFRHRSEVGVKEEEKLVSIDSARILEAKNVDDSLEVGLIRPFRKSKARHIQLRSINPILIRNHTSQIRGY
jgi:hypothetical protein